MAKFVSENPNPFGWNPLQYKGLPTHDWYLPVLPYSSAVAIKVLPFLRPDHVYRLLVVTCVCLGPVTMFLFVLEFTRTRATTPADVAAASLAGLDARRLIVIPGLRNRISVGAQRFVPRSAW